MFKNKNEIDSSMKDNGDTVWRLYEELSVIHKKGNKTMFQVGCRDPIEGTNNSKLPDLDKDCRNSSGDSKNLKRGNSFAFATKTLSKCSLGSVSNSIRRFSDGSTNSTRRFSYGSTKGFPPPKRTHRGSSNGNNEEKNKRFYALKTIDISKKDNETKIEKAKGEFAILKSLDHPYIIKAFESFEIPGKKFSTLLYFCSGGNLWSKAPYEERDVVTIMNQLMSAVAHMHYKGIIHRNLKLENIIFDNDKLNAEIKIIDLSLSTKITGRHFTGTVGSLYAMAPEMIKKHYTEKADCWACGIIAFSIIANKAPFSGKSNLNIMKSISEGKYQFKPKKIWDTISKDATDFISKLLEHDAEKRMTALQALNHVWIKSPPNREIISIQVTDKITEKLIHNEKKSILKHLALHMIASRATKEHIDEFRPIFNHYDTRDVGAISFRDFGVALSQFNLSKQELKNKFRACTFSTETDIYYTDFIAILFDSQEYINKEKLEHVFRILDRNDVGFLEEKHILCFLNGTKYKIPQVKEVLEEAAFDGDGKVTLEKFLTVCLIKNDEKDFRDTK